MSLRFCQADVWAATALNWHEPCCSLALDHSLPPSYLDTFRKMPPVQPKNPDPPPTSLHMCCNRLHTPHHRHHLLSTNDYSPLRITLWSFSYWKVLLCCAWNSETVPFLLPSCSPSSPRLLFSLVTLCRPTPALLASSNGVEHYSRALYRQLFCWVIIVYVGCILGDWWISNKEFVTHFAEWALWCPPCWIFCFSSTSS